MNDEELIYQFATTTDEAEANELAILLTLYFLAIYDDEKERFAKSSNVENDDERFDQVREDYAMYVLAFLYGMRDRTKEKKSELSGVSKSEAVEKLRAFVEVNYERINRTESGNAKQVAQLEIVARVLSTNTAVTIYKRWVARPGACQICRALDGTILEVSQKFLTNGQIVQLEDGSEFIYNYIDRSVAIAHPNCGCTIEFSIQY